jgi:hypothetical protein
MDYWEEIRDTTETQKVKRTETQRIARVNADDAAHQRKDAHQAGLKTGYTQAASSVLVYLRHIAHYEKSVDLHLLEDWMDRIAKWRKNGDIDTPPPELTWERHGPF